MLSAVSGALAGGTPTDFVRDQDISQESIYADLLGRKLSAES